MVLNIYIYIYIYIHTYIYIYIYIVKSVYKLFYKNFKMLHCLSKSVHLNLILVLCDSTQ